MRRLLTGQRNCFITLLDMIYDMRLTRKSVSQLLMIPMLPFNVYKDLKIPAPPCLTFGVSTLICQKRLLKWLTKFVMHSGEEWNQQCKGGKVKQQDAYDPNYEGGGIWRTWRDGIKHVFMPSSSLLLFSSVIFQVLKF